MLVFIFAQFPPFSFFETHLTKTSYKHKVYSSIEIYRITKVVLWPFLSILFLMFYNQLKLPG